MIHVMPDPGINNTDIMLLESYTAYSQNKEKAASRFFIMQCSQSINQEIIKVPLKDVIERFVLVVIDLLLDDINVTIFPIDKIMALMPISVGH